MDIQQAAAFYRLNQLTSKDLSELACSYIQAGIESESLVLLAGTINPIMSEVGNLFEKSLSELGYKLPPTNEALFSVAKYYAKQIIDEEVTPYQGAKNIWWHVTNLLENPSKLLLYFVGAASEIEDLPYRYTSSGYDPDAQIKEYENGIIESAREILSMNNVEQFTGERRSYRDSYPPS
ncbi:MAG: hypothetical protein V6Z89_03250 [Desulfobacter sp.]